MKGGTGHVRSESLNGQSSAAIGPKRLKGLTFQEKQAKQDFLTSSNNEGTLRFSAKKALPEGIWPKGETAHCGRE